MKTQYFYPSDHLYSKYVASFKATGCPNPNIFPEPYHYWSKLTDTEIFEDMMQICTLLRDGDENAVRANRCCNSKLCVPTACNLQTKWSTGKYC